MTESRFYVDHVRITAFSTSHSLQHELADKGIRIQAVLPGATATDFWDKTGLPYQNMPVELSNTKRRRP